MRRAVVVLLSAATAHIALAQAVWRPAIPRGLDLFLPVPDENELTREKAALGRLLFFDPILSRDSSLACASCHDPARAFTDGRARSVGISGRSTTRSAPTLVNRAWGASHSWDGRSASLEQQVLRPIVHPDELGISLEEVAQRLRSSGYRARFASAVGREPDADAVAKALASYVRTILSGDSPFDRYVDGDTTALSPAQRDGLRIFRGKGRCSTCHVGTRLTDEDFHNTGVAWVNGALTDSGRYVVTRHDGHRGAFKTPTLREIVRTAPYMHDGSLAKLEDVIDFYDAGGRPNPWLDPAMRRPHLSRDEKAALLEFLRALGGTLREGW